MTTDERNYDAAEGDADPSLWAGCVVKLATILVVGIFLLGGVVTAANITKTSVFYDMYQSTLNNFQSGYSLAALMVLVVGASAIMNFLGFV